MMNVGAPSMGRGLEPVSPQAPENPPMQQPTAMFGQQVQASPEEQAQYEKFVSNALNVIYNDKALPAYVETLKGDGDPKAGLAMATVQTIAMVAQSAEAAGLELSGDVVFHAGKEIFEDLADLSADAGIKDYTKDQDALDGAYFMALDQFQSLMADNGRLDQSIFQADMQKLMEMDGSGEFEATLRRLAEADDMQSQQQ